MKNHIWIIFALLFTGICNAQEPPAGPAGNKPQESATPVDERNLPISSTTQRQSTSSAQNFIPIPIRQPEAFFSRGALTFEDEVFQNSRNLGGFSLSAYESYSSDVYGWGVRREDSTISSFRPRLFMNLGESRSRFHLDLAAYYRRYQRNEELNGWDYFGNAQYSRDFSRRASLVITNQFASSYNDASSFNSPYSPLQGDYFSNSNEILFSRQRINRNLLDGDFSFQLNRKAQFSIRGGYNLYQYSQEILADSHTVQIIGNFGYNFNRWLNFSSRYQHYLNRVSELRREAAQIQRMQIGGLDFHPTHYLRLWAGGGVEYARYQGNNRFMESINAGISYINREVSMSLMYQRGLTSSIGIFTLLQSDMFDARLGYRLTSRVNVNMQGYYSRNRDGDTSGILNTFSSGAGFELALQRNLFLKLDCYYQNQHTDNFVYERLGLNRMNAQMGLQYVWPSRRRSDY